MGMIMACFSVIGIVTVIWLIIYCVSWVIDQIEDFWKITNRISGLENRSIQHEERIYQLENRRK